MNIADDTPIIPEIIADAVYREALTLGTPRSSPQDLADRAERHYRTNDAFARRTRSAHGREHLAAFMRHWLAAEIPHAPAHWANGAPLTTDTPTP